MSDLPAGRSVALSCARGAAVGAARALAPRATGVATRVKTTTTGCLFAAGGAAGALTTAGQWGDLTAPTLVLLVLTLVAVLVGALLVVHGERAPQWCFHAAVAAGSVLVGTAALLGSDDTAAMGVAGVFSLCSIGLLYFFNGLPALLHACFQVAALATSMVLRGIHPGVVTAQVVVQVALVIVVGRLVLRAADSVVDSLTGLPNRRGFDEHLDRAVTTAHRAGAALWLALIDVDHFKAVNDSEGHAAGDALLSHLARTWSSALPDGCLLSRQGGDEFALLVAGATGADVEQLCHHFSELAAPVRISVGVAQKGDDEDGASLVRRADTALYSAKASGRSCTRVADPADDALMRELASAVATRSIDVVFQPVVRPSTGEVVAVEALARWDHPERGAVSPCVFVSLAERTGLMSALGLLLLERACTEALVLRAGLGHGLLLTVNVSGQQLTERGFVDALADVLMRTGWPTDQLVLEVTESTVEIASAAALATLKEVRDMGVAVAIDDFGTGYSAFSHLDTLPADYLKLDAAFTALITSSTRRAAMLVSLLDLCDQLGITVIAEGVESRGHADLLSLLGCPLAQGFYYARPTPVRDLLEARATHPDARSSASGPTGT